MWGQNQVGEAVASASQASSDSFRATYLDECMQACLVAAWLKVGGIIARLFFGRRNKGSRIMVRAGKKERTPRLKWEGVFLSLHTRYSRRDPTLSFEVGNWPLCHLDEVSWTCIPQFYPLWLWTRGKWNGSAKAWRCCQIQKREFCRVMLKQPVSVLILSFLFGRASVLSFELGSHFGRSSRSKPTTNIRIETTPNHIGIPAHAVAFNCYFHWFHIKVTGTNKERVLRTNALVSPDRSSKGCSTQIWSVISCTLFNDIVVHITRPYLIILARNGFSRCTIIKNLFLLICI